MNGGKFDGGQLTDAEKDLRDFYARLLTFSAENAAVQGQYAEIHSRNRQLEDGYNDKLFSFVRWSGDEQLIVVSNFDAAKPYNFTLEIPADVISAWQLADGHYVLDEQLYGTHNSNLVVDGGVGQVAIWLEALESVVLKIAAVTP